jgi:hypothetical protein
MYFKPGYTSDDCQEIREATQRMCDADALFRHLNRAPSPPPAPTGDDGSPPPSPLPSAPSTPPPASVARAIAQSQSLADPAVHARVQIRPNYGAFFDDDDREAFGHQPVILQLISNDPAWHAALVTGLRQGGLVCTRDTFSKRNRSASSGKTVPPQPPVDGGARKQAGGAAPKTRVVQSAPKAAAARGPPLSQSSSDEDDAAAGAAPKAAAAKAAAVKAAARGPPSSQSSDDDDDVAAGAAPKASECVTESSNAPELTERACL